MWIKTSKGLINLAHAFDMSYDRETETLAVWWAFPLPKDSELLKFAELYDVERLSYYTVTLHEWEYFQQRAYR